MKRFFGRLRHFLTGQSGATAVEYSFVLAATILVCLTAVQAVANYPGAHFDTVAQAIGGSGSTSGASSSGESSGSGSSGSGSSSGNSGSSGSGSSKGNSGGSSGKSGSARGRSGR